MLVEMLLDACSRNLSLVDTEVESVGTRDRPQGHHGLLGHLTHLGQFLRGNVVIIRNMPIRAYQQVSCVIGIQVQHRVHVLPATNNQ